MSTEAPSEKYEEFIGADDAAALVGMSTRVIHAALRSGDLRGRNMRGRRGWILTKASLRAWVDGGNNVDEAS